MTSRLAVTRGHGLLDANCFRLRLIRQPLITHSASLRSSLNVEATWLATMRRVVVVIGYLAIATATNDANADGWSLFSGQLRRAETQLLSETQELDSMGRVILRNTTPQVGAQSQMKPTPPPQPLWLQIDLGEVQSFDRIVIVPTIIGTASELLKPYAFPKRFRIDASNSKEFDTFQLIYESDRHWLETDSPLPVVIQTPNVNARFLRLTVTELANVTGRWTFSLSEIMVLDGNRNLALQAKPEMIDTINLAPVWDERYLVDGLTPLGPPIIPPSTVDQLPEFDGVFFQTTDGDAETWFEIDFGQARSFDELRLFPVHARQGADYPGYAFPSEFRIELYSGEGDDPRVIFQTTEPFPNPGSNPVFLSTGDVEARRIRFVCEQASLKSINKMGLSEFQVLDNGRNIALNQTLSGQHWRDDRPLELLIDNDSSYGKILTLTEWADRWERLRHLRRAIRSSEDKISSLTTTAKQRAAIWTGAATLLIGIAVLGSVWLNRIRSQRHHAEFRMQLAQDLHDEIGSNLAAIARIGEVGEAIDPNAETQEDWRSVRELASECTESIRETLWLLGGPDRMPDAFAEQLRCIAQRMLPGMRVEWIIDPEFDTYHPNEHVKREWVMAFKAILANVAQCSRATEVNVTARPEGRGWKFSIEDNGQGFDATRWRERMPRRGMGLDGMSKRIQQLGGSVEVESKPNHGSRVTIHIR